MNIQKVSRILCLLLAVLVLFGAVVRPMEVQASEIALYAALAVSARSAIASLIRACGVYVADGIESQLTTGKASFESLTDSVLSYVWAKLPDNLKTVNALSQLMVKMVLKNGVYYAPRTLVELVCDGISANVDLDSTGYTDYATQLGFLPRSTEDLQAFNDLLNLCNNLSDKLVERNYSYCYFVKFESRDDSLWTSPFLLFTYENNIGRQLDGEYYVLAIPENTDVSYAGQSIALDGTLSGTCLHDYRTCDHIYTLWAYSASSYVIERQEGTTPSTALSGLSFEDDVATIDSAWSAKSISVTDDRIDTSSVTMLPVSVYDPSDVATASKSEITSGTVVDAETETITDTVPDAGTDSDTGTTDLSGILGFLQKILNAIISLPELISNPIDTAIKVAVNSIVSYLSDGKIRLSNISEKLSSIGTTIKEAITAVIPESWAKSIEDKLASMEDFFSATKESIISIPKVLSNIWEWIKTIPQVLVDALATVFVPAEGYLDAKVDTLLTKFSFIDGFRTDMIFLAMEFKYLGTTPPVIYIPLSNSETSYSLGSDTIFLDLSWYAKYKPTVDSILSAFLWLVLIYKLFIKLPGIISGLPGDFVMGGLNDFGLADHLPSRNAAYEVQRQSNREYIRKGGK